MNTITSNDKAAVPARQAQNAVGIEKPVVCRASILPKLLVYPFLVFSIYFMFEAFGDWEAFVFFTVCFLLFLIPTWNISIAVRLDDSGVRLSRLFGIYRREVNWNEIERIEPAARGLGTKLIVAQGKPLAISSQMSRYSALVEALRTLRPDLFPRANAAGFATEAKQFQKNGAAKYGMFVWSLTASVLFLGSLATAQILPALLVAVVLFILWRNTLFAVHTVNLEGDRLSAQSFRRMHEVSAQHIKDITMTRRYNRKGVATHFIQVTLPDASKIELTGFPEGNEILYGSLKNWWAAAQNT
jgi:hypothetical protein